VVLAYVSFRVPAAAELLRACALVWQMRLVFTYLAVSAFAAIGVVTLIEGNYRIGAATICLAVANGLLLI
jgi:hypothetical protein